jgi:hypothetical protein
MHIAPTYLPPITYSVSFQKLAKAGSCLLLHPELYINCNDQIYPPLLQNQGMKCYVLWCGLDLNICPPKFASLRLMLFSRSFKIGMAFAQCASSKHHDSNVCLFPAKAASHSSMFFLKHHAKVAMGLSLPFSSSNMSIAL